MIKYNRYFVSILCAGLLSAYQPESLADQNQGVDNRNFAEVANDFQSQTQCSYGQKINEKALRMIANFDSSLIEIPKNIINTTNDSNIFFGLVGGLIKGVINTVGRMGTSFSDLITLPIPTKPVPYPLYPWEDFDKDTRYGTLFSPDSCPDETVVAIPDAPKVKPRPAVVVPPRQELDNTGNYNDHTSRKLDTLFKKQMMK